MEQFDLKMNQIMRENQEMKEKFTSIETKEQEMEENVKKMQLHYERQIAGLNQNLQEKDDEIQKTYL
jgi:hypothetical protein